MEKFLFIFGTRPEAIKLAPLIKEFQKFPEKYKVKICVTGQHREMLDQVLKFFDLKPDYDLNIMQPDQSLFVLTANIIKSLEEVFNSYDPKIIFVQGDTTTAFLGALGAFYQKKKIAHIEAGLRSYNKYSPFPEEINRVLISHIADFHFAPTKRAQESLAQEGIKKNVWVVGNTVIDALFLGLKIVKKHEEKYKNFFNFLDLNKRIILVTGHRRESFGQPFRNICQALKELVKLFPDIEIVYPVHLNPHVQKPVKEILGKQSRIHLIKPLEYPYLIWLMNKAYLILTDSGGIQEEAPSLGKPVLVMRNVTERTEGIEAGTAKLVGTNKEQIIKTASMLLSNAAEYQKMAQAVNPYGSGKTSLQIRKIIEEKLKLL